MKLASGARAEGELCRGSLFALLPLPAETEQAPAAHYLSRCAFKQVKSLHPRLAAQLAKLGFERFTRIQLSAYVPISRGADVLIKSITGSGKTLAYLVPLFNRLMRLEPPLTRHSGTRLLVLAPTHELCAQIAGALTQLGGAATGVVAGCLAGGEAMKREKERLRKGLVVVVGTPGRVLYHLRSTQAFSLGSLETLVVDECDRVLDLGFRKAMDELIAALPAAPVQKVLLSACLSEQVAQLLAAFPAAPDRPPFRQIGFEGDPAALALPARLSHHLLVLEAAEKPEYLVKVLLTLGDAKAIVFFSTADQVNFFQELLAALQSPFDERSVLAAPPLKIHGYMQQRERKEIFAAFAALERGVLLTTDVGSRGLDFRGVKLVLLYDPPPAMKDYVNRVGRTARMFAVGIALSFVFSTESDYAEQLRAQLAAQDVPRAALNALVTPLRWDLQIRRAVQTHGLAHAARRAFVSFCRAYSLLGDQQRFNLKALNLHYLARSYGLEGAKASAGTAAPGYLRPQDAKRLSASEQSFLERKKRSALLGARRVASRDFANQEFM